MSLQLIFQNFRISDIYLELKALSFFAYSEIWKIGYRDIFLADGSYCCANCPIARITYSSICQSKCKLAIKFLPFSCGRKSDGEVIFDSTPASGFNGCESVSYHSVHSVSYHSVHCTLCWHDPSLLHAILIVSSRPYECDVTTLLATNNWSSLLRTQRLEVEGDMLS